MILDSSKREEILQKIWGLDKTKIHNYQFYFDRLETHLTAMLPALQNSCIDTLVTLANALVKEKRSDCEAYICTALKVSAQDLAQIQQYLYSVSEAFYCVSLSSSFWGQGETLSEFIQNRVATKSTYATNIRFPKNFNAYDLEKAAGVKVQWTYDINEHLQLAGNDDTIKIFPSDTMLRLYEETTTVNIWPSGFITETRNTLLLLLPDENRKLRIWLAKVPRMDPTATQRQKLLPRQRYVETFEYWGDKLLDIKDVTDNPDPRNFFQLCCNHRKPMQFGTIWIASLAFLLSLIACIEGAMQVYKAYHPTLV